MRKRTRMLWGIDGETGEIVHVEAMRWGTPFGWVEVKRDPTWPKMFFLGRHFAPGRIFTTKKEAVHQRTGAGGR